MTLIQPTMFVSCFSRDLIKRMFIKQGFTKQAETQQKMILTLKFNLSALLKNCRAIFA